MLAECLLLRDDIAVLLNNLGTWQNVTFKKYLLFPSDWCVVGSFCWRWNGSRTTVSEELRVPDDLPFSKIQLTGADVKVVQQHQQKRWEVALYRYSREREKKVGKDWYLQTSRRNTVSRKNVYTRRVRYSRQTYNSVHGGMKRGASPFGDIYSAAILISSCCYIMHVFFF